MSSYAVGVDLGGTNVRVAIYRDLLTAVPGAAPEPLAVRRQEVGATRAPETMAGRVAVTIRAVCEDAGVAPEDAHIGVGFAGMLRGDDGFVVNSPHFGWLDVPFGQLMTSAAGCRVVVENDVNAITVGEARLGAARGSSDVLAVLAGTGIGGGVIANGALVTGGTGCAGEIGHTKVVIGDRARACHCGKRGCIEAYVGGHNLRERIRSELAGGARSRAVELASSIDDVQISHLDQAAGEGDDYAVSLYQEIAPLLGLVLANAVSLLNPNHLVLGGGVLARTPVLKEMALATMVTAVNPPALADLSIVDTVLGDDAGLVGAALLALAHGSVC